MRARVAIHTLALMSVLLLASGSVAGVDGVTLIDQARALAGGVTPDDTPGLPVTVSLPGSYRLSGNLTVPDENTTGIEVTADNVSIDLNGFAILGPTVCSGWPVGCNPKGAGNGIRASGNYLSVSNGTIRGMGLSGIHASLSACITNVRAIGNGSNGMVVGGGILTGNYVFYNGKSGIFVTGSCTVTGNFFANNGADGGLWDGNNNMSRGVISGNTFNHNKGVGMNVSGYVGYQGNVFTGNNDGGEQVEGGFNMGNNMCDGAPCP